MKILKHLRSDWFHYGFETLAVVVGILIAFALDNWNEDRKNEANEKEYITRLTYELKSDIQYYKEIREKFIIKEERLKRIVVEWQSNKGYLSDSIQYINDYISAGDIGPWYNEPVIWTQLIQTGELKLIRDQELIDVLFTYYNPVKKVSDNFLMHPMEMTNKARQKLIQPFKYENLDSIFYLNDDHIIRLFEFERIPDKDIYEYIWDERDEYLDLYITIAFISKIQHQNLQVIIKSGQSLLENLELKHLKHTSRH